MYTAQLENQGPFTIRYPRGKGVLMDWKRPMQALEIGRGRKICDGEEVAILTIGHVGNFAQSACRELNTEGIYPAHYDLRFVKPLDKTLLHEVFSRFKKIITVEDGCLQGGMGSAVLEFMADNQYHAHVVRLGIPDSVIEHGEQAELWEICGYDEKAIIQSVHQLSTKKITTNTIAS
jgi:1-deoxy-D-xylulose-5-phosphate synthase